MTTYLDPEKEKTVLAQLPDGRYVYGLASNVTKAGGRVVNYEEGEAAGNVWDSLEQPRN